MNIKKYKISKKTLYIIFLLFPLIKVDVEATNFYFGNIVSEIIDDILVLWQFVSFTISIFILFRTVIYHGASYIKKFFWLECLLCISLSVSTLTYTTMPPYRIIRELLPGFTFLLIANNNNSKYYKNFLQALYYNITILMLINSLFMYFGKPWQITSGNAVYYLFGLDNYTFMIAFCGYSAGFLYQLISKGYIGVLFIGLYVFIGGAYFYTNASTAIIISLLCIVLAIIYKIKIFEILDWKKTFIIIIVIFIGIVGSNFVSNRFEIIFSKLGKTSNFSGRTHIWMIAFKLAKDRLLLGYGLDTELISRLMISHGLSWEVGHLHNVIVEYLVKGGIIALIIFAWMWISEIVSIKHFDYKNKKILSVIYGLFIISFLMYMFDYRIADISSWLFLTLFAETDTLIYYESLVINKRIGVRQYGRKIY